MVQQDIEAVGDIWLSASIQAHDFVPADFWRGALEAMVSDILPTCDGYVHENASEIEGFAALGNGRRANFMGALFVRPDRQSMGVGSRLVDHIKGIRNVIECGIYKLNPRALKFYEREGFRIIGDSACKHTSCEEHRLRWTRESETGDSFDDT